MSSSGGKAHLTTIPVELLVRILQELDPPDLLNTLYTCRRVCDVFRENKNFVLKHKFIGSCFPLCSFLANAIDTFGKQTPQKATIYKFLQEYLHFANPVDPDSKAYEIPRVDATRLVELHICIRKWAIKFAHKKLNSWPDISLRPWSVPVFQPPSEAELERFSKALYQFWIYLYIFGNRTREKPRDIIPRPVLLKGFLESIDYRELHTIYGQLINFLKGETDGNVLQRPTKHEVDEILSRRAKAENITEELLNQTSMEFHEMRDAAVPIMYFSPVDLYKFLYVWNRDGAAPSYQEIWFKSPRWLREEFYDLVKPIREYKRNIASEIRRTYDPLFRISIGPNYVIYKRDWTWSWNHRTMRQHMLIWDDWRLKELGYHMPIVQDPDFQEHPKRTFWRDQSLEIIEKELELTS